jgi:hypothetical protein
MQNQSAQGQSTEGTDGFTSRRTVNTTTEEHIRNQYSTLLPSRSLRRNTEPSGDQGDGYCGPPSSPMSDIEEDSLGDSLSPQPSDDHPKHDDLTHRHDDDDDPPTGGSGSRGPNSGKGHSSGQNGQGTKTSSKTSVQTTVVGYTRGML